VMGRLGVLQVIAFHPTLTFLGSKLSLILY